MSRLDVRTSKSATTADLGSVSVEEILLSFGRGSLRIPPFQRDTSVIESQLLRYLNGVYRGMPCPRISLWTKKAPSATIQIGNVSLMVAADPLARWVINGLPRVVALIMAFRDLDLPSSQTICFDTQAERFVSGRDARMPSCHPAFVLGWDHDRELATWCETNQVSKETRWSLEGARRRILGYSIPFLALNTQDPGVVEDYLRFSSAMDVPPTEEELENAVQWIST